MSKWNEYSEKFLLITPREQYLIILTGLIAIVFSLYSFAIDPNLIEASNSEKQVKKLTANNAAMKISIDTYEYALQQDPSVKVKKEVAQYEKKLLKINGKLLSLTSGLIDPIQMRHALLELLKVQKGVSLLSFQLVGAQNMVLSTADQNVESNEANKDKNLPESEQPLQLYRHGIKLKLKGSYFQLRDYLSQLESLSWKFFWQEFNYNLQEFPNSELEIEMYSLSTKQEFVGV